MPYSITKTQRSFMILSVAILILEMLYANTVSWFNFSFKPDPNQLVLLKIVHVIAYGHIMINIFRYFSHNRLKVLQITTLVVAITEIIGTALSTIHNVQQITIENMPQLNKVILMANSVILNIAFIIWLIFLFITARKDYPAISSLQKYGIGILLINLMGLLMPLLFKPWHFALGFRFINLAAAINYLFLLEFSMKVSQREVMIDQRLTKEKG